MVCDDKQQTLWSLVRERTIPTERPPLIDAIYCQLLWLEGCRVVSAADRPVPLLFLSRTPSVILTRLSVPRSRRIATSQMKVYVNVGCGCPYLFGLDSCSLPTKSEQSALRLAAPTAVAVSVMLRPRTEARSSVPPRLPPVVSAPALYVKFYSHALCLLMQQ
jgi:hypothetical protein